MLNIKTANHPLLALSCLIEGLKLLSHPALRKYLLIPILINIVLYSGAFVLGYYSVSTLIDTFIPTWLSWLSWILWPLFFLSFMVVGFFSFTLLANLIAAPYYSQLSSKALEIATGKIIIGHEQAWDKVFLGELRRIAYLLLRLAPLLLLFLIPVVNLIAPVLWTVFAAWGIAMEFLAYPLENRGLAFPEQKQFLQQTRWGVLSFGGLTGFALTLPIINLLAGQAAVIGATLFVHRLMEAESSVE